LPRNIEFSRKSAENAIADSQSELKTAERKSAELEEIRSD